MHLLRDTLRWLWPGFLVVAISASAWATDVRRYTMELQLDPAGGTLEASVEIDVDLEPGQQEVVLLLNRGLSLSSLAADRPLSGFEFRREDPATLRYAQEARPLVVRLTEPAAGGTLRLTLAYGGAIEPSAWGVNLINPEWVELGQYSGWFPMDPEMGLFAADVRVRVPEGWRVLGSGRPNQVDAWWVAEFKHWDMVVIAAPRLLTRTAGQAVQLHGAAASPERLEAAAAVAASVLDRLSELLGPAEGESLDVVFSPRERGGGYVRPGLAVLTDPGGEFTSAGWTVYLAHEISHLWWCRAQTTTWEDWVNESFAEATALLLLRERLGEEVFSERVDRYREAAAAAPAIEGIDRSHPEAYNAFYRKGPLLLLELERQVGREDFLRFLRAVSDRRAASTREVLAILADVASPAAAAFLEQGLRKE